MKSKKIWNQIAQLLIITVFTAGITSIVYELLQIGEESKLTALLEYWPELKPLPKVILSSKTLQSIVLTLVSFVAACLLSWKRTVRLISGFASFVTMLALPFFHIDLPQLTITCILIITCFNTIDCISPPMEKKKEVTTSFILFCIIPAFCLIMVPQTNKPLQWTLAKNIWKRSVEFCMDMKEMASDALLEIKFGFGVLPKEYRMRFTGYSGEGELTGEVSDNNREMIVAFGRRPNGNLYLNGAISDTYTGSSWEKDLTYTNAPWVKEAENNELLRGKSTEDSDAVLTEYTLDYAELIRALALSGADKPTIRDSANNFTISLTHSHLKTKSLFYPLKTYKVDNKNRMDYRNEGPNLTFAKAPKNSDDGYKLSFTDVDYESEFFRELLLNASDYSYGSDSSDSAVDLYVAQNGMTLQEGMSAVSKGVFAISSNTRLFSEAIEVLPERARWIRDNYVNLPDTLPDRVRDLALEITGDYETDCEKMDAITAYLGNGEFTYTKRPRQVEGTDFVDTFLFETKEGYCTYFATALAVLGRCAGVPTRYVEGFYCDYSNITEDMDYVISGSDGHAWCEYYVEGIGWVLTESVSGAGFCRAYRHVASSSEVNNEPLKIVELDPLDFTPLSEEEVVRQQVQSTLDKAKPYLLLGALVLILITVIAVWQIRRMKQQKWYRKASEREKVLYLFGRMKALMRHLQKDVTSTSNFTVSEWVERMISLTADSMSYRECTEICLKAEYSTQILTRDQVNLVEALFQELRKARERLMKEKREREKQEIREKKELLKKVKRDRKQQRREKRVEERQLKKEERRRQLEKKKLRKENEKRRQLEKKKLRKENEKR